MMVAPPRKRVVTRVLVPLGIVVVVLAMLAYAARESLRPGIVVRVVPVVVKGGAAAGGAAAGAGSGEVVQAPGWVEADPYAVGVPALTSGVVRELLVLEGERVKAGQVVAQLVDDDAKLALRRAEAGVEQADAALAESKSQMAADEARAARVKDDYNRKLTLAKSRAVSEGELAQLRLMVGEHEAICIAVAATVRKMEAEARQARVMLDEAKLALERTQVKAPVAGVVLARLVEPGQRVMPDANNMFAGVVMRVYDPAKLQVRVDVPLADAAKVRVGDEAEVSTEALAGRVFKGKVTRYLREANLQKNTVQVKVALLEPAEELKPEMLARVRVLSRGGNASGGAHEGHVGHAGGGSAVVVAPKAALQEVNGAAAMVWVLDIGKSTAEQRHVKLGSAAGDGVEVLEGLRPGDRLIVDVPAGLKSGAKVKAMETGGGA